MAPREQILAELLSTMRAGANPSNVAGQRRFGITPSVEQLGLASETLRGLARTHRRNHALALALWATPLYEARLLAGLIEDPNFVTRTQMEGWVLDFDSWSLCDNTCMHCFRKTEHAFEVAGLWHARSETFVKRAGFTLMATLAVHAKKEPDARLLAFLPFIEKASCDERNFVRKAVNWALRQIGKRNAACRHEALACAERILKQDTPSARWIARDALRELRPNR